MKFTALCFGYFCIFFHQIALCRPLDSLQSIRSETFRILPENWNPKLAGDDVMSKLVKVTDPAVKGAHDAEMVIVDDFAYIVAEVNEQQAGENASWPFVYSAMSIVNLKTLQVEKIIPIAKSGQIFLNGILPLGSCFVPRILRKDNNNLRCFFASENPGIRQSQTWYMDFDLNKQQFTNLIFRAKIKTASGVEDMIPVNFYRDAVKQGFRKNPVDHGFYIIDSFKEMDGVIYVAINNYVGRQNALSKLNDEKDTFEIIGHFNDPQEMQLCESAVNRLPDGTWMAIIRQDAGNYVFSKSNDGKVWGYAGYSELIPNGSPSKPTFNKFNNMYYLGWQEAPGRFIFNIDVSIDGVNWERKYRFEARGRGSFQYPSFHEYKGSIWLCVTQGGTERIMFGKLEDCNSNFAISTSASSQVCPGTSVTLSTSNCNGSVSWNVGAIGSSISVSPSTTTTYTATCTENNCITDKIITVPVSSNSLILTGTAIAGAYKSTQTLISTQVIPLGTVVSYQTGESITLQPSFQIQAGSLFQTEIKRCN
ncbi:3-coathanger stack domain-containing protein [Runella sp.]|uniref:3-coathanger stack domain-containing protein n=1 Tax=Runella sp. TaxID=1960881 RepID=UPI003D0F16A0